MKFIVKMRWPFALLFMCIQLPLLAQKTPARIDGPSSVCPNTTVRFTFAPSSCTSVIFGDVQGPLPVTVVARTNSYIDVIFPVVTTSTPFRILANYSCQDAEPVVGNLTKDVTVKTSSVQAISSESISCSFTGTYTFRYGMEPTAATNISWSNTMGWPLVGQVLTTDQAGIKISEATFNVNNPNSGTVTVSFGNAECASIPAITKTYNVVRPTSSSLPAPVFTAKPTQQCLNTTTTFAVQPYANAINYIWNSSQPGIKINDQTPPVTIPATANGNSVTVTSSSTSVTTNISVIATSVCGQTLPATTPLTVGRTNLTVSGPSMVASGDISDYICSPILTGASYEWQPGGAIIRNGAGSYKIRVEWPEGVGGVPTTVGVKVSNHPATCGGFIVAYTDVYVADPGIFLISPNPASANITVSAQSKLSAKTNTKTAAQPVQIKEIMIVDKFNNMKKIVKYPSGTTNISVDVSNLPADMYILRIRSNDTWISKQIIVSAH